MRGVSYGGVIPAREMVTEEFGRDGQPFPRAGARGEYVLVSWTGQEVRSAIILCFILLLCKIIIFASFFFFAGVAEGGWMGEDL